MSTYDTDRTACNRAWENNDAAEDAEFETRRGEMEDFVDELLNKVPHLDFAAFSNALAVKLPEHIEFHQRFKQRQIEDAIIRMGEKLPPCNRRALFPTRLVGAANDAN